MHLSCDTLRFLYNYLFMYKCFYFVKIKSYMLYNSLVYNGLVLLLFDYADLVWGDKGNNYLMKK